MVEIHNIGLTKENRSIQLAAVLERRVMVHDAGPVSAPTSFNSIHTHKHGLHVFDKDSSLKFEPDCGILDGEKRASTKFCGIPLPGTRIPSELLRSPESIPEFHVSNADHLDVARCKTSTDAGLLAHSPTFVVVACW